MTSSAAAIAQRIANAESGFVETLMAKGLTRDDARRAMRTLLRLKAAKLDPHIGRISVTHGQYLETDVLRRAAEIAD